MIQFRRRPVGASVVCFEQPPSATRSAKEFLLSRGFPRLAGERFKVRSLGLMLVRGGVFRLNDLSEAAPQASKSYRTAFTDFVKSGFAVEEIYDPAVTGGPKVLIAEPKITLVRTAPDLGYYAGGLFFPIAACDDKKQAGYRTGRAATVDPPKFVAKLEGDNVRFIPVKGAEPSQLVPARDAFEVFAKLVRIGEVPSE